MFSSFGRSTLALLCAAAAIVGAPAEAPAQQPEVRAVGAAGPDARCDHLPAPNAPPAAPNDPGGCGIEVLAFAEEGRGPSVPGPLLRVPEGTEMRVSVRNELPDTLWVKGLEERPAERLGAARLAPGVEREFRFRAAAPGTYYYFAAPAPPLRGPTPSGSSARRGRGRGGG